MYIQTHICLQNFRNSYILASEKTKEAIVIDPAGIDKNLIKKIENSGCSFVAILLTSPRSIHANPIKTLSRIYPINVYSATHNLKEYNTIPSDLTSIPVQADVPFTLLQQLIHPISISSHGMHTIVYRIGECLFTGDVLGAGNIGEPVSSFAMALLKEEIQQRLLHLPANTLIFPASGPPSTVAAEIHTNPYLQETQNLYLKDNQEVPQ